MDWISLLNTQQADFLQRLKKTKTNKLTISLLESQVKSCYSEVMVFWGETLTKLLEIAHQKAEIVAKNPPPTPPDYPDSFDSVISFPQYFQQQVENYLLREQIVECVMTQCWGTLVQKVSQDTLSNIKLDDEGNLRSESKFTYLLIDNPKVSIQVCAVDGESFTSLKKNKITWSVNQEDLNNHQILIFLCLFYPFKGKRGYEKQAVITGFLPTDKIEFTEPKFYITPSKLFYAGGLFWYLTSLVNKKNTSSVHKVVMAETIQTLSPDHPLKRIVGDWECWQTLQGHNRGINCLAFSPGINNGGETLPLVASGSRGETKLWDLTKGELIGTLSEYPWTLTGVVDELNSLAFSPDGQTLVSGGADSTIKIWHVGALDLIDILHKHNGMVRCVAFTPDGHMLATGGDDRKIMFWDLIQRRVAIALSLDDTAPHALAFSPNGQILVTGSYRKIKVWRILWQKGFTNLALPELLHSFSGHSHIVRSLAVSPDGKILVSGSRDKTIKTWHLETGELMHTLTGHADGVYAIALSPDGQIIASGSLDKTIKLWHVETGELLGTFTGHTNTVTALAFTSSGEILVSGSLDKTIKIWHKS
ncbi:WD40 repeat domain-containing protein [Aetokthonos hydrillicola Thurmond2011]|jgi:WD40 repeat protein|uniref:WD40 repeat domain-containing protein n=1 Tax=Aetokthonos hydrillicola Thurmond2011 TaxID=2712845 RepID=A0AAP5IBN5_9CYAN|nr:WD40 repeat domain-containing protein [Aetokthonos hydrillicola]MBO3460764.1 WD40 repeat domain-containing protein [Aetokthonos hydrillicola CCALA 1050]MBW4585361.1 WD40 repeat domain-containing protein [Aetokthonos hydrillicola CCALA 1050]MDR9897294.1 WD40 repeat domain-containing protein [Aetokthonos hydrillicola Thurmond2011]